jgi:hypothetical protein
MEKVEQKIKDALIKADVSGDWSSFLNIVIPTQSLGGRRTVCDGRFCHR